MKEKKMASPMAAISRNDYTDLSLISMYSNRCNRFIISVIRDFWPFSEIPLFFLDKTTGWCRITFIKSFVMSGISLGGKSINHFNKLIP
jgi:hypothetical protein